jgi:hypothetical protein
MFPSFAISLILIDILKNTFPRSTGTATNYKFWRGKRGKNIVAKEKET